jgi:hypothetical protein
VAGTRPVPPDGTRIDILEANLVRFRELGLGRAIEGRIEGGVLRAEGFGGRALNLVGIAPDGSLARLRAAEGEEKGEPASFAEARTLVVVVKGEDGAPVQDACIVIKDDAGEPLTKLELPNAEGKFTFSGVPAGLVVVCPLAHWDYGGAEAARLELKEETTRIEVVVGNAMEVGVRIRVAGKPRLPERMDLHLKYPGPGPLDGLLNFEPLLEKKEDPERGEVRFTARPHAPGKPLVLELTVPGSEPRRAEVKPPAAGEVAWGEFDL